MGASSRYRSYQFIDILENKGFKCKIYPLLKGNYIKALYKHQNIRKVYYALVSIIERIFQVLFIKKYDLHVIEKELIPYFPPILEVILCLRGKIIILDYDDAIFHNYENIFISRLLFGNKIPFIMNKSHGIIAGNPYILDYAKQNNINSILIPTCVDLKKYTYKKTLKKIIVGWIGSPSTSKYILDIILPINKIIEKYNCEFHLIGFDLRLKPKFKNDNVKIIKWSYETELKKIACFDIGIMPLEDSNWCKGKCGLKIIQYMATGIPVVASPIGINSSIVEDNINGFLADSDQEWIDSISTLIEDNNKRQLMGNMGRQKVQKFYDIQNNSDKLINFYEKLIYGRFN